MGNLAVEILQMNSVTPSGIHEEYPPDISSIYPGILSAYSSDFFSKFLLEIPKVISPDIALKISVGIPLEILPNSLSTDC